MQRLSGVEAQRVIAVLDDAIDSIATLTRVPTEPNPDLVGELAERHGDAIADAIEAQVSVCAATSSQPPWRNDCSFCMQQSQWRLEEGLGVIKRTTRSRADTAASTAAGGDGGAGGGAGAGASWGLSLAEGARPETAAAAKVFEALSSSTKSLSRAFRAARAAKADLKAARSPSAASSQFVHYLQVKNVLLPVLVCVDD